MGFVKKLDGDVVDRFFINIRKTIGRGSYFVSFIAHMRFCRPCIFFPAFQVITRLIPITSHFVYSLNPFKDLVQSSRSRANSLFT